MPPEGLRNAAEQISQIRPGSHRSLAKDRPGCPEPVTSFYGFPCKYPVEEGMDVCAMHRRAKAHPDTDSTSYALAAVQMHEGWAELRARVWNLDKRALQSERLRLFPSARSAGHPVSAACQIAVRIPVPYDVRHI